RPAVVRASTMRARYGELTATPVATRWLGVYASSMSQGFASALRVLALGTTPAARAGMIVHLPAAVLANVNGGQRGTKTGPESDALKEVLDACGPGSNCRVDIPLLGKVRN